MEKSIQPLFGPDYPFDTQVELPGMDGHMGLRSALFGLRIKNTWLEFPEASSMPAPGRMPDAIAMPSLKPSGATWGRWISGSREAALWSRGMSIGVLPTTLSANGLDLAQ